MYFIKKNGIVIGPYSQTEIKTFARTGMLGRDDHIGKSKTGPWYSAGKSRTLFGSSQDETPKMQHDGRNNESQTPPPQANVLLKKSNAVAAGGLIFVVAVCCVIVVVLGNQSTSRSETSGGGDVASGKAVSEKKKTGSFVSSLFGTSVEEVTVEALEVFGSTKYDNIDIVLRDCSSIDATEMPLSFRGIPGTEEIIRVTFYDNNGDYFIDGLGYRSEIGEDIVQCKRDTKADLFGIYKEVRPGSGKYYFFIEAIAIK